MWNSLLTNARSLPLFDWKVLLPGIDIGQFRAKYLNPAPGEALRLLCPDAADCPEECHYRKVRELSSGLKACCPMDITRPRIPVTPEDIGIFRLNYARVHKEIADALGIEFSSVDLDDAFFWELGCLKTGTGSRMPVYFSYYFLLYKYNGLRTPAGEPAQGRPDFHPSCRQTCRCPKGDARRAAAEEVCLPGAG